MRKRNVTPKVERLLKSSQRLRDSDKELLMAYWQEEGLYLSETQRQAFMGCTPAESITRCRRDLKAKYPASEPIDNGRYKRFQEFRDDYGVSSWRG